ncbi:MAG: hypothetical protein ACQR33_06295 [Candidatus Saccharibacteria bacterium]
MPSEITKATVDGKPQTFREFMFNAAPHSMSMFKILEGGELPEEFVVEPHLIEGLTQARKNLEVLQGLTIQEWESQRLAKCEQHERQRKVELDKITVNRKRLEARLDQVMAWEAPKSHQDFKNIVIRQLEASIAFDCSTTHWENPLAQTMTTEEFMRATLETAEQAVASCTKRYKDAQKAAAYRNRWVQELRASLPE